MNKIIHKLTDNRLPAELLTSADTAIILTSKLDSQCLAKSLILGMSILKPGGILFTVSEQAKYHSDACLIEDRGFDIKDSIIVAISANESLIVTIALKEYDKTFFHNAITHQVAGFWIEGNRIGNKPSGWNGLTAKGNSWNKDNCGLRKTGKPSHTIGKFPANFITTDNTANEQTREHFHALSEPYQLNLLKYLCRLSKTPSDGIVVDLAMYNDDIYLAALANNRQFIGLVPK